ncbi:hypothetical protein H6G76_36350 [Nostoc sp. FACHB-152]|uniref:hypothetical protein n=1 Tax=unclassified Nostoc TaxID=2593658 RepID=UPI0016827FFB|nr:MULTISPECIES: hypothetical protein [unclassified Nostoc]MBD2452472.1 hypothetical protein [Nostoc sp. FACHB-152]MBD2473397.1 hypothetical protein [Nostoc sp. FACHB-145]
MYQPDLLLPRPYLISPALVYCHSEFIVRSILNELILERANQDLMQIDTVRGIITYRELVLGEFYRQTFENTFSKSKLHKKLKPLIMPEVTLWKAVFKMLEYMFTLNMLNLHPALLLRDLVEEAELTAFIATNSARKLTVKDYLTIRQHQNRELQGCENPFDRKESPRTWEIMDSSIKLANLNDEFRKRFYMPVVRARQKITAYMKKDKSKFYINGKMQRQGRKKESIA